ncbi:MAG TPA: hypothetical protein VHF86_08520, partial [Xanthomonadaceae bacterium]|nr:hypothetical protein [Xanthomonadaceae bacterium]
APINSPDTAPFEKGVIAQSAMGDLRGKAALRSSIRSEPARFTRKSPCIPLLRRGRTSIGRSPRSTAPIQPPLKKGAIAQRAMGDLRSEAALRSTALDGMAMALH